MKYFNSAYFDFFRQLARNNNKEWFHQHKEIYVLAVEKPFRKFVEDLLEAIHLRDPLIQITPDQAIFRITRDMRFAKGLPPYKLHRSALISEAGRKSMEIPAFYIELSPMHIKLGGGIYKMSSTKSKNIQSRLSEIELNQEFREKYGSFDFDVKRRQLTYETSLTPLPMCKDNFLETVMDHWSAAQVVNQSLRNFT